MNKIKHQDKNFDVLVIGAGPAGIMAALKAAECGASVAILEKNGSLGKKLLLTGGGRCNITNANFNNKELAKEYGKEGFFILPALSFFDVKQSIKFFEDNGIKTKIEGNKVFCQVPVSEVVKILENLLAKNNVKIFYNSVVKNIESKNKIISKIITESGEEFCAKNYVLATGGKSYCATGSTGDGYKFAQQLGHKIEAPSPALVPIKIKNAWVKNLQGISLSNVKIADQKGEIIFTHFGLSGPAVLNASAEIAKKPNAKIILDLFPKLNLEQLKSRVGQLIEKSPSKNIKNCLSELIPERFVQAMLNLTNIDASQKCNYISKQQQLKLAKQLKKIELDFNGTMGFDLAMITNGGVALKEIDAKTMHSKIIKNLFFVGEIINLHGPTGGYNLQACWSAGFLAGQSASRYNKSEK